MREISVRATVRATPDVVDALLSRELDAVLGVAAAPGPGSVRHQVAITMEVGDGTSVSQDVVVELGRPTRGDDAIDWPVSWTPVGRRALVPGFVGRLEVRPQRWETSMQLVGTYRPPLGPVGALGDLLVHDRAESAIQRVVDDMARRIDQHADAMTQGSHLHRLAPDRPDADRPDADRLDPAPPPGL